MDWRSRKGLTYDCAAVSTKLVLDLFRRLAVDLTKEFYMSTKRLAFAVSASILLALSIGARADGDGAPSGKLGKVSFTTSCAPAVQSSFERAVAMLHSFW